jgi:L-ascorbate metabolism protein UlaG (beta-lactamase superfamily)
VSLVLALTVSVALAAGDITITPLLHSSVQLEGDGKVVQIDPWSRADLTRWPRGLNTATRPDIRADAVGAGG